MSPESVRLWGLQGQPPTDSAQTPCPLPLCPPPLSCFLKAKCSNPRRVWARWCCPSLGEAGFGGIRIMGVQRVGWQVTKDGSNAGSGTCKVGFGHSKLCQWPGPGSVSSQLQAVGAPGSRLCGCPGPAFVDARLQAVWTRGPDLFLCMSSSVGSSRSQGSCLRCLPL